jgi:hypothetical protein
MFQTPDVGLEASVSRLADLLKDVPVEKVTLILKHAGLARLSPKPNARISFVHRRLNEYFIARKFLAIPALIDAQVIPVDSRFRDALVLYCEVGGADHVNKIADYCWTQINACTGNRRDAEQQLRSVHCLRFLRDALRARPERLGFAEPLREYILARLEPGGDILAAKLSLEATGLLPEEAAEPIIEASLKLRNAWISATALRACRNLKRIGPRLQFGLMNYLRQLELREFLGRYREIMFSLSLSDAFSALRSYCWWRGLDTRLLVTSWLLCLLFAPYVWLLLFASYLLIIMKRGRFEPPMSLARAYLAFPLLVWTAVAIRADFRNVNNGITGQPSFGMAHFGLVNHLGFAWFFVPALSLTHGSAQMYTACLYGVMAFAVSPWFEIARTATRWRELLSKNTLRRIGIMAATLITTTATIIAAIYFFTQLVTYVLYGLYCLVAAFLVVVCTRRLQHYLSDRRLLRRVIGVTALTRAMISVDFLRFRTRWCRMGYVSWLRDAAVQPTGEWPNNRPHIVGDDASTVLAQLDERWLGLDV